MLAMQYQIPLPSDYDMGIIRKRVENSGNKTDGFPGLKMKAYLVAEKEKYGNIENQYAPFYVWEDHDGMNQFLLKGPFNNIINSFGRPTISHWIVIKEYIEKSSDIMFACVKKDLITYQMDLTTLLEREEKLYMEWTSQSSTKAYLAAYSPFTWEICRFYMTTNLDDLIDLGCPLIYDVHHIS